MLHSVQAGETDEEYAKRLQEEDERPRTRNRGAAKPARPIKKRKEKNDDGEVKQRNTGLHATVLVSEALAVVLGTAEVTIYPPSSLH